MITGKHSNILTVLNVTKLTAYSAKQEMDSKTCVPCKLTGMFTINVTDSACN